MRMQNTLAFALLASLVSLSLVSPSPSYGQEKENDAATTKDESPNDETADGDTKDGDTKDGDTKDSDTKDGDTKDNKPEVVSIPQQIRDLLVERKPAKAAAALKSALESDPNDQSLKGFHQSIAGAFLRVRKYSQAMEQLEKAFQNQLERTDSPRDASRLVGLMRQIQYYGQALKESDPSARLCEQALEKMRELETDYPLRIQESLTSLIDMRGSMLVREDAESSKELIETQLAKLTQINESEDASETIASSLIELLITHARLFKDTDGQERVATAFGKAMEEYPESEKLMELYASNEYYEIRQQMQESPDLASERLEGAVEKLTPFKKMRAVASMLRRIESLNGRIESARKQQQMIGKPAPELDIDGWANADGMSVADLKGKVVLYDFWAIWCGPCIATFPHLRELREEFGDKGFEVLGITRYYGYAWDEENERAVRSSEEATPEMEQEAITKFLQSKEMKHPCIVTPKETKLQSNYGVTGIPHVVLVDREGNIQMIKVGSGQDNADALHAKIKELIEQ